MKARVWMKVTTRMVSCHRQKDDGAKYVLMYASHDVEYWATKTVNVAGWKDHIERIGIAAVHDYAAAGGRPMDLKLVYRRKSGRTRNSSGGNNKQLGLFG